MDGNSKKIIIGILALQGAVDLHIETLKNVFLKRNVDYEIRLVKTSNDLEELDGIILPGGESTTMINLMERSDLNIELKKRLKTNLYSFGTCAGLILLANYFKVLDCNVKRNAYGSQIDSFETKVDFVEKNLISNAFFIRAPRIQSNGETKVIAVHDNEVVGVSNNHHIGLTFHPEVAKCSDFHDFFIERILSDINKLDNLVVES
ncbi:MAG: pyridoxal 5'-phosphate synthase glutaminase subunit PdxT [Acidimicrobiia bacterium]